MSYKKDVMGENPSHLFCSCLFYNFNPRSKLRHADASAPNNNIIHHACCIVNSMGSDFQKNSEFAGFRIFGRGTTVPQRSKKLS